MKNIDLIYKLEGENLESIDVLELAPILLSLGKLIQESKKIVNPDSNELSISVKPFEKGSFIVDLAIVFESNLEQLVEVVKNNSHEDVLSLLKSIGLISGASTISLVGLYKFLKGKPKKIEPDKTGGFTYYNQEGVSVTVDFETHALYQSKTVQENMSNTFSKPLESSVIQEISSYTKSQEDTVSEHIVIPKEESQYFIPQDLSNIIEEDEEIIEQISEIFLRPKRGSYEGEGKNWSFRRSDHSKDIVVATIKDIVFLEKVASGKIRIYHEDLLKVKLLTRQKIKGKELHESLEIVKVLDYRPAGEQKKLL